MAAIEVNFSSGICDVLLNRPEVENAINEDMLNVLAATVEEIEQRDDIRGVLIRGAGSSFCTGIDPREAGTGAFFPVPMDREYLSRLFADHWSRWRVWRRFAELSKPLVTAVHGRALGEGALFAMVSSWCVASEDAVFGDPSIRMGMASANPLWLWAVGPRRAREILFGRYIDATTAMRWGLVTRVVSSADLESEAWTALEGLVSRPGMTGFDGRMVHEYIHRAASEAAGLSTAQEFAQTIAAMSSIQRYGFRDGEYNFWARVGEIGIEEALVERDTRYEVIAGSGISGGSW
ncbi:MAG: enoyl-CoA hydratase/isomerase family protein [Thermomicrobiales bacterium]